MDDIDSAVKNAYFTLYSYMVMRKASGRMDSTVARPLKPGYGSLWFMEEGTVYRQTENSRAGGGSEPEKRAPLGGGSLLGNKRLSEEEI